jgi:ribulose-phosphate 3-epimerase
MTTVRVCAAILGADFAALGDEVCRALNAGADWAHCDVMDHHAVPNLSIGPVVVASIRKRAPDCFLDVHLIVDDPPRYVGPLKEAGANQVSFHFEDAPDVPAMISSLRKAGIRVSIALRPETPAEVLFPYLDQIDMAVVMTARPGFTGQAFMPENVEKVRAIRRQKPELDIQVDGGVNLETVQAAAEAGANVIAAGAIFRTEDPKALIAAMREILQRECCKRAEAAYCRFLEGAPAAGLCPGLRRESQGSRS